jgi:hypothetical protein
MRTRAAAAGVGAAGVGAVGVGFLEVGADVRQQLDGVGVSRKA